MQLCHYSIESFEFEIFGNVFFTNMRLRKEVLPNMHATRASLNGENYSLQYNEEH